MTAKGEKSRVRQLSRTLFAVAILIIVFRMFSGTGQDDGPRPQQVLTLIGYTLADYAALSADDRRARVAYMAGQVGAPQSEVPRFIACMGAHAVNKKPDLDAADVFGWCDADRTQNRKCSGRISTNSTHRT